MRQNLQRNHSLTFRVNDEERDFIREKMKKSGIVNQRHFLAKMVLEGCVIHVEMDSIKEMNRLLSNISNTVNQIARKVNVMGYINHFDANSIKCDLDKIWTRQREILKLFAEITEVM